MLSFRTLVPESPGRGTNFKLVALNGKAFQPKFYYNIIGSVKHLWLSNLEESFKYKFKLY